MVYRNPDNDTQSMARQMKVWPRSIGNLAPPGLDVHDLWDKKTPVPVTSREMLLLDAACRKDGEATLGEKMNVAQRWHGTRMEME